MLSLSPISARMRSTRPTRASSSRQAISRASDWYTYPKDKALERGTYRVTFQTGEWFAGHKTASFFPEVPVIFAVDGTVPHYHIPLLLSPYGFSTYRRN